MILELNGTKVTIVDKTLGYQGDNLVNTIQVTVDKDSTWNYKLDMYKGKSKCFDSVVMTREGNVCTVELTDEILSYGGRYTFQLRGYTDAQTYHSEIFEAWVNASIEYQCECKQADCGCDCKLPTEFYQIEDNVTEINNHPPYPGDAGKWMIWDVNKHEYVESDIEVSGGGGEAFVVTVTGEADSLAADKTFEEISTALNENKSVICRWIGRGNIVNYLTPVYRTETAIDFSEVNLGVEIILTALTPNHWTVQFIDYILKNDLAQTVDEFSTDDTIPSAKAVYDYGQSIAESAGKIDAITVNGTSQTIEDKTAKIVVNKSTVGLGNVDNTSDVDKPVSTAQATAIAEAKKAGTTAQTNLETHVSNKDNPHEVTKTQIGLENVDNTSDADKPVSTKQATAIADAKKAGTDAQINLAAHISDEDNPHGVTKAQVGLGNVDNTADKDKPISTTTQTALNGKLDKTAVVDVTANAVKGQAADAKSVYDSLPVLKTWTSADVEDAT